MKDIFLTVNAGTSALTVYTPVPCRGVVKEVKAAFNKAPASDDTVTVSRGTSAVNTLTTGATDAGVVYTGTPDSTNKDLIFDPDSSAAANKLMKIAISALPTASTIVSIWIKYDDSAAVKEDPSEA